MSSPSTTVSLSASIVVAAVEATTTKLDHDDYKNMNFTEMRTDHWGHSNGYDCRSSSVPGACLTLIYQLRHLVT
jgi:hypothetical protein